MMSSLTTWKMRYRYIHRKFMVAAKLGHLFDMLEGRAAVQRDPDRLEKPAGGKLQDISMGKC